MSHDEKEILEQKFADASHRLNMAYQELELANKKLKEYEEKAAKAEKASRMKSLFLANMSHEIRTPLNAIEGFSRIMAETDSFDERMTYMEIIESNNSRLLSLVNEILDLSRVESGEIVIKNTSTDLNSLMSSIKQLFKFRCSESVNLTWTKPNMPVVMTTDENRLTQVFSNLISNALKHTPKGTITYGYRLINEGSTIEFYVSDTGSGIPPEFIDKIFDTYASKDAEHQKGYGLGLALCRIIVEKMGGRITVKSKVNEGSTFTFTLPFHGSFGGLSMTGRTTTQNMRTLRVSNRKDDSELKKVLVAEDEESNYELVRIVLQKRYRLLRAHNGIEAVTLNEEEKPDLILMDIRMPEMDGLDATRIIKEINPDTPIIALSAYAFNENIQEAKAAGCDLFLAKPFKVEELLETIKKFIGD
ncbi:ATP-binding protein [Prevotella sp. E13-17]|uniref:ATP-binding response regulator n=1 Tax=Prevotella sp. E13-17 TaxID=2913616 RepID=UPI001EDB6953|nr:ATP-binding protein [Prevotella sp. E13-17]UKK50074.1 ATP-binding protein [Prevotella sp. E13-17]